MLEKLERTLTVVSPMELRSSVFISLNWISVGSARIVAYMYSMQTKKEKNFIRNKALTQP